MSLPRISLLRPSLSLRFFIYLLFVLIILVLAVEGGYYFWLKQKKTIVKQEKPGWFTTSQEGIFTLIESSDGFVQKLIRGTVEKIDGDRLTIRVDNDRVEIRYKENQIDVIKKTFEDDESPIIPDDFKNLLPGEEVQLSEIKTDSEGSLVARDLAVFR